MLRLLTVLCSIVVSITSYGAMLTSSDIDTGTQTGSTTDLGNGDYTVTAGGEDVWNGSDHFRYLYQSWSGDLDIRVRVDSIGNVNPWSKAGVMLRASADGNSKHVFMCATPGNGFAFQHRDTTGAGSLNTSGGANTPPNSWVRLVKRGTTVTGYSSNDGTVWYRVDSLTWSDSDPILVGVAVTSHDTNQLVTAEFRGFALGVPPGPINGFVSDDINTHIEGATSAVGADGFSVAASGGDVWNSQDGFRFVHRTWSGNFDFRARVASVDPTDYWAKAGVMVRQDTSAGSVHAFMLASAQNGYAFQRRTSSNGNSDHTWGGDTSFPNSWVRLTRNGETLTGLKSSDGHLWEVVDTITLSVTDPVEVGLAVTAHNDNLLCKAEFRDVKLGALDLGSIGTGDGLSATYYDNLDFSGATLQRIDPTVDFSWGLGSPDQSIGADTFSVRWLGQVQAKYSEPTTLYLKCDDGARLWFNGQLVIDTWHDQGATEYTATVDMVAGQKYDLRLEYYENGGYASCELGWSGSSISKQAIPQTQLYSTGNTTYQVGTGTGLTGFYFNSRDLTGNPALIRTDGPVSFDWQNGAPEASVAPDNFSVRWLGEIEPQFNETYTFYFTADDGARVWVANKLLINSWKDQGATEYSASISLKKGQKVPIKIEYYENGGQAVAKLAWSSPSTPKVAVPATQLYGLNGIAAVIPAESVVSPAFVEGIHWSLDGQPYGLTASGAYGDVPVTRLSSSSFYFNVPLNPSQAVSVSTANLDAGTASGSVLWKVTDLTNKSSSADMLRIRVNDSLLIKAGAPGQLGTLNLVIKDGEAVLQSVPAQTGTAVPILFNTPGVYTVAAELELNGIKTQLGSMLITVISAYLHGPTACQVNYQRNLDVAITPASETRYVPITPADPAWISIVADSAEPSTLHIKPTTRMDSNYIARIETDGPILGYEVFRIFEMESLNRHMMGFVEKPDGFKEGLLRFKVTPRLVIDNDKPETPEREGLYFELSLLGSSIFFSENGQTTISVHSNREDADGIVEVPVTLSPNGNLQCHDLKAYQINSPTTYCGDTNLNNPHCFIAAAGGLYLQREMATKVNREGRTNLYPKGHPQENKQIFKVWDRQSDGDDQVKDGRWTQAIRGHSTDPIIMEQAFFAPKVINLDMPNRWFTGYVKADNMFPIVGMRFEKSKTFPPRGGAEIDDNQGVDRDEVLYHGTQPPRYLAWKNGFPDAYPGANVPPNFYRHNFYGLGTGHKSWDFAFTPAENPAYMDFGFHKGNMIGNMDVWATCEASPGIIRFNDYVANRNPQAPHDPSLKPDADQLWSSPEEVRLPDLITVGRLEADGYTGKVDENGYVTPDTSSRDAFPDIVGANTIPIPTELDNPDGSKRTVNYQRTQHDGNKGLGSPTPVQITFRAPPGTPVNVAVAIARRGEKDIVSTPNVDERIFDGARAYKAWVHLKDDAIFESRGLPEDSDDTKAQKVAEILEFNDDGTISREKPAERVVTFSMITGGDWLASKVIYVYGMEASSYLDDHKLVVWGEEVSLWKAKQLYGQSHHNENLELADDDRYDGNHPIKRWYVTDEQPLNVIKVDYVVPDDDYNFGENPDAAHVVPPVVGSSTPAPTVTVDQPEVQISGSSAFVVLSGSVHDILADNFLRNTGADIANVEAFVDGDESNTVSGDLSNGDDGAALRWKQHPYLGTFGGLSLPIPLTPGSHNVTVRTGKNAAGYAGQDQYIVTLGSYSIPGTVPTMGTPLAQPTKTATGTITWNIVLVDNPSAISKDSLHTYWGERELLNSDPQLSEADDQLDSLVFHGVLDNTPATISIDKDSFAAFQSGNNFIEASVKFDLPNGRSLTLPQVALYQTPGNSLAFRGEVPVVLGVNIPEQTIIENIGFTDDPSQILYWKGDASQTPTVLIQANGESAFLGGDTSAIRFEILDITFDENGQRRVSASIQFTEANGLISTFTLPLIETQVNSGQFQTTRIIPSQSQPPNFWYLKNVEHGIPTDVGTPRPFKIRISGPSDLPAFATDYQLTFADHDFEIELGSDGFWYPKGGSDQVFAFIADDNVDPDNFIIIYYDTATGQTTKKVIPKADLPKKGKGKPIIKKRSDIEKIVAQSGAQLVKFKFQTDLNMDGVADDKDEAFKRKWPRYIRPNDNVPNGERDDANWDDDLDVFKVIFDNGGLKLGQVWVSATNNSGIVSYTGRDKKNTSKYVADLEKGEKPDPLYFLSAEGQYSAQKDYEVALNYGIYNQDPTKAKVWLTEKIVLRLVRELGDADFFNAARAYIIDNDALFYTATKSYTRAGNTKSIKIVVMRQEGTKMTALETYNRTPKLKGIDMVVSSYPEQTVVINGNLCTSPDYVELMTTKACSRVISGGAQSPASIPNYKDMSTPVAERVYLGQDAIGDFSFGTGEVPATGLQEGIGGFPPGPVNSNLDTAVQMIGAAPSLSGKMIFTLTSVLVDGGKSGYGPERNQSGIDAKASGANWFAILDGSTSVALAHRTPGGGPGPLTTQFKGTKHTSNLFSYYINTYVMFRCTKPY